MSGYLLDTNCLSELVRPIPNRGVVEWVDSAEETLLYLSVLTLGEIRKGLAALPHGKRRIRLEAWLEVDLRARFAGRIVPIDAEIADRWGSIAAQATQNGTPVPVIDGLLAATALHHNLTVVSRNANHFHSLVRVLNPWKP